LICHIGNSGAFEDTVLMGTSGTKRKKREKAAENYKMRRSITYTRYYV
jgi:hypothetical protein